MNKAHRCFLHLACIAIKLSRGRDVSWHWEHVLREFGVHRDHSKTKNLHVVPHH